MLPPQKLMVKNVPIYVTSLSKKEHFSSPQKKYWKKNEKRYRSKENLYYAYIILIDSILFMPI